jgi:hypothetical protein
MGGFSLGRRLLSDAKQLPHGVRTVRGNAGKTRPSFASGLGVHRILGSTDADAATADV